ncbi:MAG TPA: ThuA domain-containing protein, partial [Haliangiales bacterium]|nr:ThuA domain-containing protein [Haliangiales bacterium]
FVGITAELATADGSPQQTSSTAGREKLPIGSRAEAQEALQRIRAANVPASGGGDGDPASGSGPVRVLIVGGGSSHDFDRWFNQEDSKTLSANGRATVKYTDKPDDVLPALKELDVLYLSNNQPLKDPALRKGIFDFAEAGKGLLLVHPALWYNWADWPEYNRALVGGGARSHDKYGEFEVHVNIPQHPIMAGLPRSFKITDELYHFEPDKEGKPILVLAYGNNLATGRSYPVAWIVKSPTTRIVCITLGHDGAAHELPAYQTLLQNALKWAAGK